MGRAGVRKIVAFNFPWYIAALAINLAAAGWLAGLLPAAALPAGLRPWAWCALAAADYWLLASVAVSHYVYDRSPLAAGAWLEGIADGGALRVAVLHAGQDEASEAVTRRLPKAALRILDFHDPRGRVTGSLRRARAWAGPSSAEPAHAGELPLASGSLDLAVVAFAAHELRTPGGRAALFRELRRAVGDRGRIRLVEHVRDGWNLLAYGPGAFHFLPRRAWDRAFAAGGLRVAREWACTPFVRVFELEAAP
jgi:SAM-dependent methyltransferase